MTDPCDAAAAWRKFRFCVSIPKDYLLIRYDIHRLLGEMTNGDGLIIQRFRKVGFREKQTQILVFRNHVIYYNSVESLKNYSFSYVQYMTNIPGDGSRYYFRTQTEQFLAKLIL